MQTADVQRKEQVLLDGDELARDKAFFQLGTTRHSPDHRLLAWLADEAGSEFYTARVRVIDTGIDLADALPDVSGSIVWTHDAAAFFYVRPQTHRGVSAYLGYASGCGCAGVYGRRSRLFRFNQPPLVGTLR
jgi:oligopeptidase B